MTHDLRQTGAPRPERDRDPSGLGALDERAALVLRAIGELDAGDRDLWRLRVEQEQTFAAAAQAQGYASEEATRRAFHRVQARLVLRLHRLGVRGIDEGERDATTPGDGVAPAPGADQVLEDLLAAWFAQAESGAPPDLIAQGGDRPDLLATLRDMAALAHELAGASAPPDPLLGRCLGGRYVLTGRLGAGGMGLVYAARDRQLSREVAVKVLDDLFARDPSRVQRFQREAQSLAALDDPHIVAVHDLDLSARPPYLVMDRIFGFDLGAFVRALRAATPDGRLPERAATRAIVAELAQVQAEALGELFSKPWPQLVALLGQQMCRALRAAHDVGVVHRDLKPSNFMLDASGRLRLLDFGLARRDLDPTLTRADARVGSPTYMAPEQVRSGEATAASDLYALGATLYELLCLQPPFAGQGSALETSILCDDPPPPRERRERVPRDLAAVCLKALAKAPVRRYASAAEFAADLQRFVDFEPVLARPRTWPAPVRAAVGVFRRYRGAIVATAVLVLVAAVAATTAGLLLGTQQARATAADLAARRAEAARLHEGLSPYLGFAAGREDRLLDPGRAGALAALDRILALTPEDDVARFLLLWTRGEETPPPATVAADRAELTRRLGAERMRRLYEEVALRVQQRDRIDRAAGAAQMEAALRALDAEPRPWSAIARRLHVTVALQLAEFDADRRRELSDAVLTAIAEDEAERHRARADVAAGDAGRTAFSWFARGAALHLHDDLRGARDAYGESDRLCPGQPATLHALARVHRRLERPSEARAFMEAALKATTAPHVNHLEQHALVLMDLGEFAAADAVLARFPDDRDSSARRHLVQARARTRQAALDADVVARERCLADADASITVLRALADQGGLSDRQVRALATCAADVTALRRSTPADRIAFYVSLLRGEVGGAPGDPLHRQILHRLGDALLEDGQDQLGELFHAQALALERLAQDGVRVR